MLSGRTKVVGVWGYPVSHSRSPAMHNAAIEALGLDWVYVPFAVAPQNIAEAVAAVRALDLVGVNITVPLKELTIPHLDAVHPDALTIGSVNTIVNDGGKLTGHSTDGPGFLWDLERRGIAVDGLRALVWGAGGSARAIACALTSRGCQVTIANRTLERAEAIAKLAGKNARATQWNGTDYAGAVRDAEILVNTTTLGMGPSSIDDMPPVPDGALHDGQIVYDLVYAPKDTLLLKTAEAAGCRAIGGLGMLVCQGAVSLSYWTRLPIEQMPVELMLAALGEL